MTRIGWKKTYGKQKDTKKYPQKGVPDRQSSVMYTVAFPKHTLYLNSVLWKIQNGNFLKKKKK